MDELLQWPDGVLGATLRWIIIATLVYLAVLWVALVAWSYRDVRQRTRDPLVQFFSVLLVLLFFLPGHWVYLILRPRHTLKEVYDRALEEEALLQELDDQASCAGCRRRVRDDWLLCPSCGLQLKEPCESCQKPLSYSWVVCPQCGTEKAPRPGTGLRRAAPRSRAGVARGAPPRRPQAARTGAVPPRSTSSSLRRGPSDGEFRQPPARSTASRSKRTSSRRDGVAGQPVATPDDSVIDATSGERAPATPTDA